MRVQLDSIVRREGTSINQSICIAIAEKIIRSEEIMEANKTGESAEARTKAGDYPIANENTSSYAIGTTARLIDDLLQRWPAASRFLVAELRLSYLFID